jgi:hypothetical protein
MRSRHLVFPIVLAGPLLVAGPAFAASHHMMMAAAAKPGETAKLAATRTALRGLWQGHIAAVRKVVVAAIAHDAAAEKTAEGEVVANAHAIAGAIEPFYGAAARDKLFQLLAGHYGAVKAYLEASIAKDEAGQSKATSDLTSNADEIATFLSGANPNLPKATVMELLQIHAGHHISQIQELIAGQTAAEAKTRKEMSAHMNVIADAITNALAKQFPAKFA